jgi:hypothetical protein
MANRSTVNPVKTRTAVLAVAAWLRSADNDADAETPARAQIAEAVRLTARTLAAIAPGASVEVRVPPFVAVQCIAGPRHTRGTPPNVVETDPLTWLRVATGLLGIDEAAADGRLELYGSRAREFEAWLPLVGLDS